MAGPGVRGEEHYRHVRELKRNEEGEKKEERRDEVIRTMGSSTLCCGVWCVRVCVCCTYQYVVYRQACVHVMWMWMLW